MASLHHWGYTIYAYTRTYVCIAVTLVWKVIRKKIKGLYLSIYAPYSAGPDRNKLYVYKLCLHTLDSVVYWSFEVAIAL